MASKQAASRLRKELKAISVDPPPHIHVACDEANILHWSYLLEGPADTPYEGGWYWGRLKFPKDYPFAPPSIMMVTPSGRFEPNTRLCLSMSDYHPESWQPAWSLATVLKGLLSFMCEESPTAGAVDPPATPEERRRLARLSLEWNKAQPDFMKAFPEVDTIAAAVQARRQSQGDALSQAVEGEATATAGARPFSQGDAVRIRGLQGRADLNGLDGKVEPATGELAAATAGRVLVRVAEHVIAVRPENLELLLPGDANADAPAEPEARAESAAEEAAAGRQRADETEAEVSQAGAPGGEVEGTH